MFEILDTQNNNDVYFNQDYNDCNIQHNSVIRYTYPIAPKLQTRLNAYPSYYCINVFCFAKTNYTLDFCLGENKIKNKKVNSLICNRPYDIMETPRNMVQKTTRMLRVAKYASD